MMRCLEHIPVIGHAIAAIHACRGDRNNAERAAINATVGIVLAPVNIVAEMVDEATRDHSERLQQVGELGPDLQNIFKICPNIIVRSIANCLS